MKSIKVMACAAVVCILATASVALATEQERDAVTGLPRQGDAPVLDADQVSLTQLRYSTRSARRFRSVGIGLLSVDGGLIASGGPYDHIAVNTTYHGFLEGVETFPERMPRTFNVLLATFKTWMADLIVQCMEHRSSGRPWSFDWKRSALFAAFGFLYVGVVQWFLYVSVLTRLFPDAIVFANSPMSVKLADRTGMLNMVGQIFVDNCIFECLIYFPFFYTMKEMMQGGSSVRVGAGAVSSGLRKYWKNIYTDNLAGWAVWIPADVVIFAVPMFLRMPTEHGISFGWTMFMSAMRGAPEKFGKASQKPEMGAMH